MSRRGVPMSSINWTYAEPPWRDPPEPPDDDELPEGDEITDLHLPDGSCCEEEE